MIGNDTAHWNSSKAGDWITPGQAFEKLDREFQFYADLAADETSRKLYEYLGPGAVAGENALEIDWYAYLSQLSENHWPVGFLNPPYSGKQFKLTKDPQWDIAAWTEKAWLEAQHGCTIVGVIPAAIQTKWWQRYVWGTKGAPAHEIRLVPHRWDFVESEAGKAQRALDVAAGVKKSKDASSAGVNHCVVVWKPNVYVGHWAPPVRYWTWRT